MLKPLRELHKPITFVGVTCCQNCRTPSGSAAAWPCATAQLIYPEDELT